MFREGQQIGQYTLIGKLGKGGFGEVWLAEKRSQFIVKRVAVKLPHEEQVNFDAIRQEATLWEAASGHPNVLPIIDADVYDNQVVIVSEYADGGSLHDKLRRETKLATKEAVEMTIGILNGLEFLHSRKIIHRDIKPQNILLQGNTPRLADFGISRAMNTTLVSSAIIGTDAYMSPEAFDGKRSIQTDIWSVGVVLYQLLKGSLPFPQEHPTERMFAVLTKDFEPLSDEFPADLRRIIDKSLAKQTENRFQTTTEMRDELLKAHVPLAHPTLAKTEVLRFPLEPNSIDDVVTNESGRETEKETGINNFLPPLNVPAPTLPAIQSESIATQFRQTPLVETALPIHQPQPQIQEATPNKEKDKEPIETYIAWSIAGVFLIVLVLGLYAFISPKPFELIRYEGSSGKYGFRDSSGSVIIPPKYEVAFPIVDGTAVVCLKTAYTDSCGLIDEKGKEITALEYDDIGSFYFDLATVTKNGKTGYVNKQGKVVIPLIYDKAEGFSNGYSALVERNGTKYKIDKYGKETDIGAADNSNTNPNISTYNTPAYNSKPANSATNNTSNR